MANPFDKYDVAVNPFDKYDTPEKPKATQDRSFLGASAESGGRALLGAGARILEVLDPNSLSEQDAATLFKDDPEGFKRVTEKSAAMALSRFANEQARRSQEIMQRVKPEMGAVSGESIQDLEYATLDPNKAAYLSPTRVAGDVLGSLPQTLALAVTAYFTKGRSLAASEQASAAALARGATQAEAQAVGRAAAIETGAQTMATVGAIGEGTLGYAGGKTQGVIEAQQVKPEVYESSPDYQALLANGYTPETARGYLAAKVGQESGLISGAVDAATNLVGGRVLGKIIGAGGPLGGRVARGFGTEGATELVQGSGEQLGQNVAMRQINPSLDLSKGVGEAAAQGFVVGGVTGGGTAAVFGSRQRDNSLQQLKDSTDAGSAAIAANSAAGDLDLILRQTVDTQLAPAINADLAGAPIPTPAQALSGAPQQIAGNPLAAASLPERQALIDRQTGLIAEANTPGIPAFDRDNLLAQAQTAMGTPATGAAANFVDLTPMTAQEAQTRLAVMRDTTANAGGNALEMAVVPHPTQTGTFAIAKQALPNLDLKAPAASPSANQSQYQIEASALAGKDSNRRSEDQPRQEIINRAMRNVQERGGVASPAEAQIFREANLGQPYDRIDPSLAPDLSVDQKLTQATGIPLTNRPRETVQTKAAEVAPAQPLEAPKAATTKEAPFNPPDAVNILVDGFTKATKDWGDRGTLAALTKGGFLDSDGVTTAKGNALLQKINTSKRSNAEINADLQQAIGMRTVENEAAATPYSPIDIGLMGERPFRANLGLSNKAAPAVPAPTTTPEEERVDRLRSSLSTVTGGIVQTDAKLSTTREQVPGSTATINDKGTEHTYTVAESGSLPGMTKLIQQLARRFGKRVVFFNSDTLMADGFVSNQDNKTLFINAKSQMSPLAVFGHELLHLLKRDNPVAYRAIAAVIAKRMDTETRAQFRQDYGTGANIEELSADLMGNSFQDANFLTDVFTEIAKAAPEGEARSIIMRLAAAINQSIKAAMDVISKMAPGTQQFKADELVKNLEEIRGALKAALVTYAKDQKVPAMQMEAERSQAESRTALTASAAAPEITKSTSRMVPSQWKASDQERRQADTYERENGIRPYLSEGQLQPQVAEATLSVKREYASKDLAKGRENHPLLGLPLNKNGTVTLYFPTTNEEARRVAQDKRLRGTTPASNRIYLTNESSAPAVAAKPGNIDQPLGGANVLIQVDPSLLQFDAEYEGGRKDFFIQLAEGQAFAKKMKQTKLFTLDAPRTKALSSTVTISDIGRDFNASIEAYKALSPVLQRERLKQARAVLKDEHNIGTLLGENGKLQKTRLGDYGLTFEDKSVASMGLGLASAQKINETANTCPKSARCESLCLGETSGQNWLYGGDGQFRSGPRLSQYLKTEALVLHPADFAVVMYNEVKVFEAWANKETGIEVFKEKGKEDVVTPKQVYQPAIRFNVTSDFPPNVFKSLINAFPNTEFYDYTKNNSRSIAPNHHLTYSSDGVAQVVEGKTIGIGSNWKKMMAKLDGGFNVAMAFTSRNDIPAFLKDEVTGKTYQVWNGDNYDARFLDPKREDGVGMIVGLTNKDRTGKPEDAALKNDGFFVDYNPERDGETLIIKDQDKLAGKKPEPKAFPIKVSAESLESSQPLFSRQRIVGESKREYTPEQRKMFENTGRTVTEPTLKERVEELRKDFALKMTQGMVDPFASIKQLDFKSYILARMSKGTAGALEAMLRYGKVSLNKGVYDADMSGGFLDRVGIPLQGELEDFLWWIAANRAERLSTEDRERLFTATDIQAGKSLSNGKTEYDYTLQHGQDAGKVTRDRTKIYRDSLTTFDEFNKNALDMAEQQGLIDPESRKLWEHEFYVPFYRLAEEDGSFKGGSIKDSLVRQKAFERLKGGTEKLNSDLLANTMQNWAHLLEASAKNAAAESALKAAEKVGAAKPANSNTPDAVWYMGPVTRQIPKGKTYYEAGVEKVSDGTAEITATEKIYYSVSDPYILASLSAISYTGMKGPVMDAMTSFKHALTVGVTASPYYKVKNLMRDSVQAVATAPLSYNIAKNLKEGYQASDRKSQTYVSALASGGLIRFGNMLDGNDASRTRTLIDRGVDKSTILDSDEKIKAVFAKFKQAFDVYNEVGSRGEELNRAALYKQLIANGVGHDQASFMARDLMDFSLQGTFQTVRFLTQVVPFMNARLQGLYKLGRSANEDPKRFGAVLGATAMFSIGLLLAFKDDDDWKKREDWDRNTNWWFKIGGKAYRIPKPFEIGAIGTLAERGLEFFISKEMTGKRLGKNVSDIILDNLSMNPIPQFAKPLLDIYSNKDSFSGRPIESMGVEKLKSDYRFNSQTSMVARGLSTAGNAVSGAVNKEFLSPVQIDHVIRGYFGWLGTFVVGATDMILRPATGQVTKPASDMWKVASGNLVSSLPSDQSRYVSQMYEQAKELEKTYATWRQLQKDRKPDEAREFLEANREKLTRYKQVEGVKNNEAKFNEMIRMVERSSSLDADEKAARISSIKGRMDSVARKLTVEE